MLATELGQEHEGQLTADGTAWAVHFAQLSNANETMTEAVRGPPSQPG